MAPFLQPQYLQSHGKAKRRISNPTEERNGFSGPFQRNNGNVKTESCKCHSKILGIAICTKLLATFKIGREIVCGNVSLHEEIQ